MSIAISRNRVRVEPPAGARMRAGRLLTCRACGSTVVACPGEVDHYERDRDADEGGLFQLYEVFRCPNRDCRSDVPDVMLEPVPASRATSFW